jgi:hypothetical protein
LAYNGELSNNDFLVKQTHLQNSHLELNKYFHDKNSWLREDIEERAEYLAEIALQIWSYFGDELAVSPQSSNLTGSSPKLLKIFGQEYSVKTWRDVLEITLNAIIDVEPDRFKDIMQQFPRFVGWDEKDFRGTRKLQNGAFVEVNLSAKDINTFCLKAIETAELSVEEWRIETAETQLIETSTKSKHKWNEQLFLSELESHYDASQTNIIKEILSWSKANALQVWWGEGNSNYGSFVPTLLHKGEKYQLFSVFMSLTKKQIGIEIYFQWYLGKPPFNSEEKRLELLGQINLIEEVSIAVDKITKRPSIPLSKLGKESSLHNFLNAFDWFVQAARAL